jgi:hypothetical protein
MNGLNNASGNNKENIPNGNDIDKEREKNFAKYNGKIAGAGMDLTGLVKIVEYSPTPVPSSSDVSSMNGLPAATPYE